MPGGVVSLSAQAADKLLATGKGDAALLYLALLRHGALDGARRALDWTPVRAEGVYAELVSAGLAAAETGRSAPPPVDDLPPDYIQADISTALEGDAAFAMLQAELQRRLGKLLSISDLKTLYMLYDHLALPPEVILMAAAWCGAEGPPPRMGQIKKTAAKWHRLGLVTPEAAEEYLRLQTALRARERTLLPILGITSRAPLEDERKYIGTWVEWGFPDEAIRLAYERTVMKKQSLHWAYMNSILKSWHGKNLHTVAEIKSGDSVAVRRLAGAMAAPTPAERENAAREELDELRRILGK